LGTRARCAVWRSEESLWKDAAEKSPRNGRALMNYGLTQMSKGDYATALAWFERAAVLNPNYALLEINLALAKGGLRRDAEAQRHFQRALQLAPGDSRPHYFFARWLKQGGRNTEALERARTALEKNPGHLEARYLLMELHSGLRNWDELRAVAEQTLKLVPGDRKALEYLDARRSFEKEIAAAEMDARQAPTADRYLQLSLLYFQAGRYTECIQSARRALELKPDYAEAWNNVAAGYNSLGLWDEGIEAARNAVRLKPDFELARNNLAHALERRQAALPH
jgi:tetratricopeptide (TPR) repeat protein